MISVSIIIPLYNVEPYITDCLQSVMRQSYSGPIECVLVDDCGTDKSMEVAEKLISEYGGPINFRILHHEHNRGLSAARNTGTNAAKGDYVYYLDSDDAISPDCILLMVEEVNRHPKVEVVQGAIESIPYREFYDLKLYEQSHYIESNDWVRYHSYKFGERLPVNATNKLLKKSFLVENALSFKEGLINEDELWSFVMYRRVKFLAVISEKTYIRYIRPRSIMSTLTDQKRASNGLVILSEALRTVDKPFRDLQIFKCLFFYIHYVFPYAMDRSGVKHLYFRFLYRLLQIGQVRLAFWFVIGLFNKTKRKMALYEMIPQIYKKISDRYNVLF